MRIKIEKDIKGDCINICPMNRDVRVGSYYCLKMCRLMKDKKVVNGQEEIECNFVVEEVKNV